MPHELRQPRLSVQLGGLELPGVLGADIYSNNHFAADRFSVKLAAKLAPIQLLCNPDLRLTILLLVNGLSRMLIKGGIDAVTLDPVGGLVTIEGRDLSALLIEAQTSETFPNRTASEIAELLAARHGLSADVARTTTAVGRYYQSERDSTTLGRFAKTTTEWDLLAFLSGQEGYDLFVEGDVLRFAPPATDAATILQVTDCISLEMQRCVSLARPMQMTVKSWSTKSGDTNIGVATSVGEGTLWKRELVRPNISADDAKRLAERSLSDLKRHEWSVNVMMPGDLLLTARSRVAIVGTGTGWDRAYNVNRVTRHLDAQRGFTQRLSLQGTV